MKFPTFAYYRVRGAICHGPTMTAPFRQSPHCHNHYDRLPNDTLETNCQDRRPSDKPSLREDALWLRDLSARFTIAYLTLAGF